MLNFLRGSSKVVTALACVLSVGCTCPQVKLPASDTTPPSITWIVTNNVTKAVQNLTGSSNLSVRYGDNYSVKMLVDDGGGVRKISLATTIDFTCNSNGVASHVGPGLASPDETTQTPTSDNMVCTELYKLSDLDFRLGCPSGGTFVSGQADLIATGANYFGGTTSATLTFNIAP